MRDEIPKGGKTASTIEEARQAMGIDWMIWGELVEAIPPVYTKFIGEQIMSHLA
jgi:DNA (cytosine-5)-methyltransferase 1